MNSIDKITICFCEGPHDTAFLYRILKTKYYETFKDSLDKLPKVIGNFIIQNNKNIEYNKLKIDNLRNEFIPNKIMYKKDEIILLYAMGGDTKIANLKILLAHYFNNIESKTKDDTQDGKSFGSVNTKEYKFLFFYDADYDKQKQIDKVNNLFDITYLKHNQVIKIDDFYLGVYIFSDKDDKGTLEDVLFKLMKIGNENIFNEAESYFDNNFDKSRVPKKIYKDKSLICISGQLQKSGASNVVIIEQTDYITLDKINNSEKLQEIAKFIIN